jgi:hypothetical protein
VVAKDEGAGNHQRNCGLSWPVAEPFVFEFVTSR